MALFNGKGPNAKNLNGMGIYHDKRKRTIYSAFYMECGYVITNDDVIKYSIFSLRFFLTIVAFLLALYFTDYNYLIGVIVAIVFFALVELAFHYWFLPQLQKIKYFEKPESEKFMIRMRRQSYTRLLISFIGTTAVVVTMILFLKDVGYTGFILYCNYAIGVGAAFLSIMSLYFIIWKLTHKDDEPKMTEEERVEALRKQYSQQIKAEEKRRADKIKAAEDARKEREARKAARAKAKEAKKAAKNK